MSTHTGLLLEIVESGVFGELFCVNSAIDTEMNSNKLTSLSSWETRFWALSWKDIVVVGDVNLRRCVWTGVAVDGVVESAFT